MDMLFDVDYSPFPYSSFVSYMLIMSQRYRIIKELSCITQPRKTQLKGVNKDKQNSFNHQINERFNANTIIP
jgi:hypothetical protein